MGYLLEGMIENPGVVVERRGRTPLGRFQNFFGYGIFKEVVIHEWETLEPDEIFKIFIEGIVLWQEACEKSYESDSIRWFYSHTFWERIKLRLQGKTKLEYPTFKFLLEHTCTMCRELSDWAVERDKPVEYIAKPLQVAELLKTYADA